MSAAPSIRTTSRYSPLSASSSGCGRLRNVLAYVNATLPQRHFYPVNLGLRSAVAAGRRADIQSPAGRRQCIHVGAAQRLDPVVLTDQPGLGFGVLELRAQSAQVGFKALDRLGGRGLTTGLAEPPGCAPRADERESCRRGQRKREEANDDPAHASSVVSAAAEIKRAA
jgi:hypothetical protein